jgi:hypothetical protein
VRHEQDLVRDQLCGGVDQPRGAAQLSTGLAVPSSPTPRPGHRLYDVLAEDGDDAHGRYNALIR